MTEDKVGLCDDIAEYFQKLPAGSIDQRIGWLSRPTNCGCVGAHLAHFFTPGGGVLAWTVGIDFLVRKLGVERYDLAALLHSCGTPEYPWDTSPWTVAPAEVFRRLAVWFIPNQK